MLCVAKRDGAVVASERMPCFGPVRLVHNLGGRALPASTG